MLGGVFLVEGETHGDTHPEVLGNLEGVTVAALDAVAVVQGHNTDVLQQFIAGGLQGGCESVKVEHLGEALIQQALLDAAADTSSEAAAHAERLKGSIAVSNAKLAYAHWQAVTATPRWAALAEAGARPQRLLWASTGTKNPAYSPVAYVEPLIGPETVNTMPVGTLDAYRAQGDPAARIEDGVEEARAQVARLATLGIDLDAVTHDLEVEGLAKFTGPFDAMMASIDAAVRDARDG